MGKFDSFHLAPRKRAIVYFFRARKDGSKIKCICLESNQGPCVFKTDVINNTRHINLMHAEAQKIGILYIFISAY